MGYLGLGSALTMLGLRYGSAEAVEFTEKVTMQMAIAGWEAALELSREKGPAPLMTEEFTVTPEMLAQRPEMAQDGWHTLSLHSIPLHQCTELFLEMPAVHFTRPTSWVGS